MKKIHKLIGLGIIALILGILGPENIETKAAGVIEEKVVGASVSRFC